MPRPNTQVLQEDDRLFKEGMRKCRTCNEVLPLESFGKLSRDRYGLQASCKPCTNQRNRVVYYPRSSPEARDRQRKAKRRWYRNQQPHEKAERNRRANLKSLYGITLEQFNGMVADQDSRCALCWVPFSGNAKPHIDHDHGTGEVRGILCHLCNVGVGHFRESHWVLARAIRYLS